jgi:hypothetical protein
MFGGVVTGSNGGSETVFSCIHFEVGVHEGLRRVRPVRLGVRPCPLSYMCASVSKFYCIKGVGRLRMCFLNDQQCHCP